MLKGGDKGAETITISDPADYIYAIFIFDYSPNPNYPLSTSGGNVDIYGMPEGFLQFSVPTEEPTPGDIFSFLLILNPIPITNHMSALL